MRERAVNRRLVTLAVNHQRGAVRATRVLCLKITVKFRPFLPLQVCSGFYYPPRRHLAFSGRHRFPAARFIGKATTRRGDGRALPQPCRTNRVTDRRLQLQPHHAQKTRTSFPSTVHGSTPAQFLSSPLGSSFPPPVPPVQISNASARSPPRCVVVSSTADPLMLLVQWCCKARYVRTAATSGGSSRSSAYQDTIINRI